MKIYFFVTSEFDYNTAANKRRICYVKGLEASNINCEIIICKHIISKKVIVEGTYLDIKCNYVCGVSNARSKIKIIIDRLFLNYLKSIYFLFQNVNNDNIIYCYFYDNVFYLLLLLVAKFKKIKIVRELCEYPHIFGKQNVIKKTARWFELNLLFPLFDGFIPISTELNKLALKFKSSKAQTLIVPILIDRSEPFNNIEEKYSPCDDKYILHTGTMSEQKDGITGILEAFALSIKKIDFPIKLIFTGPQAKYPNEYEEIIEKLGIKKQIIMTGTLPENELIRYQKHAYLSIINKNDNLQNRNCFPTKLGEMLFRNIPIITTTTGDANLYLKDNESAYIVESGNIALLSEKIIRAFMNPLECQTIASKGKAIAERDFDCVYQGKRLAAFFNKIIK